MEIAIIDDLAAERSALLHLIKQFFETQQSNIITPIFSEFENGESFLQTYFPSKYKLIFLDIYMDKLTGIDVAKVINTHEKNSNIILFSSSEDHILDGYDLRALGYVLKPVANHKIQLYKAISYALERLTIDYSTLQITTDFGDYSIPFRNIIYLEISMRSLYIHISNNIFKITGKYTDYSVPLLKDCRFVECHRNLIVNLDYVNSLEACDFILKNNEKIPISRRRKIQVIQKYMTYYIEERKV